MSDMAILDHVPETVQTARGPVEVVRTGSGPPILAVHGTPGGWDQATAMGRFLADAGFEVIAPSRPGYLGTPLDDGRTIDEQADLHAALLDALGIDRVGLFLWSGGGPSGYRLAVRHPEKVSAIVALAAVGDAYHVDHESLSDRFLMKTGPGNWLMRFLSAHAPEQLVSGTLGTEGDLTKEQLEEQVAEAMGDPKKLELVRVVAAGVSDHAHRGTGEDNDLEQFAAIASLELEKVAAPALIVQGSADIDVLPRYSAFTSSTIPDAELVVLDGGTHLALFVHPEAEAVQQRAIEHYRAHA